MEDEAPPTAYGDTFEATFDPAEDGNDDGDDAAAYLVPRLAAYAAPSSHASSASSSSSVAPHTEPHSEEDEEAHMGGQTSPPATTTTTAPTAHVTPYRDEPSRARESGERSAAHVTDDGAHEDSRGTPADVSHWENEEAEAVVEAAAPPPASHAALAADDDDDDAYDDTANREDEEGEVQSEDDVVFEDHDRAGGARADSHTFANAFAHSRVKELLKYEGSSSMISKDAAAAACEAVALLTRDLVAMAAAEATRRNRKTVNYDDVARVAQMFDRFSFLADVVPPMPATSSSGSGAGKSIVVGGPAPASSLRTGTASRSRSAHVRGAGRSGAGAGGVDSGAAVRSKTAHPATASSVHPLPGGMRQATLRF